MNARSPCRWLANSFVICLAGFLAMAKVGLGDDGNPSSECLKAWDKVEKYYATLSAVVHVEGNRTDGSPVSPLDYEIKLLGGMHQYQVTETLPPPPFTYVLVERNDAFFRLVKQDENWKPVKLGRRIKGPVEKFHCKELVEGFAHFGIPISRCLELSLIRPTRFERTADDQVTFAFTEGANPDMRTEWILRPSLGWMVEEKTQYVDRNGKTSMSSTKIRYDGTFNGVPKICEVLRYGDESSSQAAITIDPVPPLSVFFVLTHYGLSENLLGDAISPPGRGYTAIVLFLVGLLLVFVGAFYFRKAKR